MDVVGTIAVMGLIAILAAIGLACCAVCCRGGVVGVPYGSVGRKQDAATHKWRKHADLGWWVCKRCGMVLRKDSKNLNHPCRRHVGAGPQGKGFGMEGIR